MSIVYVEAHAVDQLINRHKPHMTFEEGRAFLEQSLPTARRIVDSSAHGDPIWLINDDGSPIRVVVKHEQHRDGRGVNWRYAAVTVLPTATPRLAMYRGVVPPADADLALMAEHDRGPSLLERLEQREREQEAATSLPGHRHADHHHHTKKKKRGIR